MSAHAWQDIHLRQAEWLALGVIQPQILEVHPDLSHVVEQPPQLTRLIRHKNND